MDRVRELERRLRETGQELGEKRAQLRSWRARNPNRNTLLSFGAGVLVALACILGALA